MSKSNNKNKGLKRRKFLKYSGVGVGLMIGGVWLARNPLRRKVFELSETLIPPYQGDVSNPLIWLQVTPDNKIILHSSKVEMGQGSFTSLAQLAAEELEVDISRIKVVHAETKTGNIDGMGTGGSMSVATLWQPLREMAATMRVMIAGKAADKLGVSINELNIKDGLITANGESITYGELVDGIQDWDIPDTPPLKKRSEYKYIGQPIARVDLHDKVIGAPIFGIDASYPNMLYASIVRSRLIDAEMSDFDISEAENMPGVIKIVQDNDFIGVVAQSQVQANNARLKIKVNYTKNQNWNLSDVNDLITVGNGKKTIFQKNGKPVEDIDKDGESFSLEFRSPIGAHAQIEPNGAVAKYEDGKVEIKLSTQVAKVTRAEVAKSMGLDKDNVNIVTTFLGGGFGGRLHTPHAIYAAKMSKEVGRPVKLVFDRQQEFQNDTFRPPTHHIMKAKIADDGKTILGLEHQIASGDTLFNSALDPGVETVIRADIGSIRGGALIYDALPHRSTYYHVPLPFATSFWRSLGLLANAFAIESFMDELAIKTEQDPIQLRLSSMSDDNPYGVRAKNVLKACVERSGYSDQVIDGRAMGLAVTIDGGSPCAHVAEVSIEDGEIKVHKVTAAFDCGIAVNPDQVRAQVEGCICMGISAALYEKMDLRDNKLYPINYGSYRMALMRNTPKEIEVVLIEGADVPGPVGEPPMGPIGAAVSNAIRRLTGKRIIQMPLQDYV
jgi:isoquinoline 1-oxidoreductase beta subunit